MRIRRRRRSRRRSPRSRAARRSRRPLGREANGVEDLLVSGAAAEVAREGLPYLRVGGVRVAAEQVVGGDYEPRGAEAALHPSRLDEGLLDGVQVLAAGYALDRDDLAALGLAREHQAGA